MAVMKEKKTAVTSGYGRKLDNGVLCVIVSYCIVMAFVKKEERIECCDVWLWETARRRRDVALVRAEQRITTCCGGFGESGREIINNLL